MPLARGYSQALGPLQYDTDTLIPINRDPRHVRAYPHSYLRHNGDEPEAAAHALLRALWCLSNVGATTIFTWHDQHNITIHTNMESRFEIIAEMWMWRSAPRSESDATVLNGLSAAVRIARVEGDEAWWCCFVRGEHVGSYVTTNWMGEAEGLSISVELDPTCLPLGLSWEQLLWVLEVARRHRSRAMHLGALEARRGAQLRP